MANEFKRFAAEEWPVPLARLVQEFVEAALRDRGKCSVLLTGGRSAEKLYMAWAGLDAFGTLRGIDFYFGDERCVPPDHSESNYSMAIHALFSNKVPDCVRIHRMEGDSIDLNAAADRYAAILPDAIDVLLLSVGEDGHIASIFPHSIAFSESRRRVLPITGPKSPYRRLTITPPVIQCARKVFVMAFGEQKRAIYEEARRDPEDIDAIPARLVLDRTWIFDAE